MIRYRHHVAALLTVNTALLCAAGAQAGSWASSAPFGATLQGDLYTPTTPAASPAILVAIHMCTGHSTTVHGWFDSYADKQGFYIIAPDAGKQCFDSSDTRAGDRAAIVTMVNYVLMNKHADKTRVFAAGMSSGGCMTNTLLAIYPDVFAGGSAMPGFPAGGWPAGDTTCTKCGSSPPSTDGKYWGDMARTAFAWSGTYGCAQQWVGGGDQYNFNGWLPAVVAQFQNLGNLGSGTSASTTWSGWTRTVYKDTSGNIRLETNLGPSSQKHDIETVMPAVYGDVVRFLGLDTATGICGTTGGGGMSGTGGASSAGGAPNTAGAPSVAGGTSTGGRANASGGASATGGTLSSGGASAAGGTSGGGPASTGGTSNGGTGIGTGGSVGASGHPGTAGAPTGAGGSTGGSATGTGGTTATGGHPASSGGMSTAGSSSDVPPASTGCSCTVAGDSTRGPIAGLFALGLGALFARRRRSRS
jgi:acetylxylan esterase